MKTYSVKIFNGSFYFDYMELARDAKEAKAKAKEKINGNPALIVVSARKL
jgi:hypothetical protein